MSLLHIINYYFLQFFFIRIAKNTRPIFTNVKIFEISLMMDGTFDPGGTADCKSKEIYYSIMYWVKPFSGYGSDFKYLGSDEARYKRISKNKIIPITN